MAVLGNSTGGIAGLAGYRGEGAYDAATDFALGYFGAHPTANTVWAVLDHNSAFALAPVPEPGIIALLALGVLFVSLRRKRVSPPRA
jgi:PEP-CTERM motif